MAVLTRFRPRAGLLPGLAGLPSARGLLVPGSPRLAQLGIGLACRSGHEHGGFPAGDPQLRIVRWALAGRRSRINPRTRGGGDGLGHALNIGLRQLAGASGADKAGLFSCLVPELLAAVFGCGAQGGDLR